MKEGKVFIWHSGHWNSAGLRISTMAELNIARAGITLMIIDEKYQPACVIVPISSNVRQAMVIRDQIRLKETNKTGLWKQIIGRKVENQARVLTLLGREGAEEVLSYRNETMSENIDAVEAAAAKGYFHHFHPGLNRRTDDPVNSALNYGYRMH